jgi:N-methylhydantoinase A
MTPGGPLVALTRDHAERLAHHAREAGVEAVAVVLLHSYRHPEHELAIGEELERALPDVHVSLSHDVVGTFREFERAATTEVDAALSPLLRRYLRRLVERTHNSGIPEPAVMQSNGGLIEAAAAGRHASWTVLSGPAGGAAGAAFVAREAGTQSALCFDMGGTSCDVCVVDDGAVQEQSAGEIAGRPLALPMLAVHTVGAGGGSIASRDPGGALSVGPRSAGADPGPVCYGRGGIEPTVTDANLVLGYLSQDSPLAGGVRLDAGAAHDAIAELAGTLGLGPLECAEGIIRVANAEMVRALRVVTVERGIDPRGYALLAFGGAGPLHAAAIADELEIRSVICPRASGVLAALGLAVSPRRRDVQRTVLLAGEALSADAVSDAVAELSERARAALGTREAAIDVVYELRYRGQAFELAVRAEHDAGPDQLRARFEAQHEDRYGYNDPEQELELVTIRVSATTPGADLRLRDAQPGSELERRRRTATLAGERIEFEVLRGTPSPATSIDAAAIVELPESTLVIPPGWSAEVDHTGTIKLDREPR